MKQFVDEDPAHLGRIAPQRLVKDNPALAKKAGGVDLGSALVSSAQAAMRHAQPGRPLDAQGRARERRQIADAGRYLLSGSPK